jgi:hypothetical protein
MSFHAVMEDAARRLDRPDRRLTLTLAVSYAGVLVLKPALCRCFRRRLPPSVPLGIGPAA